MSKKLLVCMFLLTGIAVAQEPNIICNPKTGLTVQQLSDGEIWATIHGISVQLDPSMPVSGYFRTNIVVNLPESDVLGAPQSELIQIEGNCQSRTVTILGALPYAGKNRSGLPMVDLESGPEGVVRKVEPNTPMQTVFNVVCAK